MVVIAKSLHRGVVVLYLVALVNTFGCDEDWIVLLAEEFAELCLLASHQLFLNYEHADVFL